MLHLARSKAIRDICYISGDVKPYMIYAICLATHKIVYAISRNIHILLLLHLNSPTHPSILSNINILLLYLHEIYLTTLNLKSITSHALLVLSNQLLTVWRLVTLQQYALIPSILLIKTHTARLWLS